MGIPFSRSNASFLKDTAEWEANLSTNKGVISFRCHLYLEVRDVGVIVTRVIMVIVWGQIFSGEVVVTSWSSKGITYRSIKLGAHTNMGSTVGLFVGEVTERRSACKSAIDFKKFRS